MRPANPITLDSGLPAGGRVQNPAECGTSTADCSLFLVGWMPASPLVRGQTNAGVTLLPHRTPRAAMAVYGRHPRFSLLLAIPYTPHTPYTLLPQTPPLLVATGRLPPIGRAEVISHPVQSDIGLAIWHFGTHRTGNPQRGNFPCCRLRLRGDGRSHSPRPIFRQSENWRRLLLHRTILSDGGRVGHQTG